MSIRRDATKELPTEGQIVLVGWQGPTNLSILLHLGIARHRQSHWEVFKSGFWFEPVDPDYWWPIVAVGTPHQLENLVMAGDIEALLEAGA